MIWDIMRNDKSLKMIYDDYFKYAVYTYHNAVLFGKKYRYRRYKHKKRRQIEHQMPSFRVSIQYTASVIAYSGKCFSKHP
jgi:hypothetical protein